MSKVTKPKKRRPVATNYAVRRVGLHAVFAVRFYENGWDEEFVAAFADEPIAEGLAKQLKQEEADDAAKRN